MKSVLCYGDSLTWGMNVETMRRHAHDDLWPSVLEAGLDGVRVINAGLNGRTTMFDDYGVPADRNGVRILPTTLATFEPLDLVILMLGTNDLKTFISGSAAGILQGLRRLVEIVQTFPYIGDARPQVLIVSPPLVKEIAPTEAFPAVPPRSDEGKDLAAHYRRLAASTGSAFFDAASVASVGNVPDGIHLDANNTRAIGRALVPVVARLLHLTEADAA